MELDFQTVKALSSPTRIKILNGLLDGESTPTRLSDEVGKTKSTVSSHLEKLVDAGLVERDDVEGRRRVVYRPTRKAESIVKGRERKVKFSFASSAVTGLAGAVLLSSRLVSSPVATADSSALAVETQAGAAGAGATGPAVSTPAILLAAGASLLAFSGLALGYGLVVRGLGD